MSLQDKALRPLLELNDPTIRRNGAEQVEHALRTALLLTEADAAAVLMPGARRAERQVLHAGSGAIALLPMSPEGSPATRMLGQDPQPLTLADLTEDAALAQSDGCPGVESGPAMFVALRQRDPVPGYLAVYRRRGRARFNATDIRVMLLLTASLASGLETLRVAVGAEKLALSDDLTQVYNGRFLRTALKRELRRAGRFDQELSVVLVDADGSDAWRAQNGDLQASVLLRELAGVLAAQVRSFDLLTRFAADQFMIVLPQTGPDGAREVAERVRAAVAAHGFGAAAPGTVTASLGVASFPRAGTEVSALLAAAERALARARERGANRVETSFDRAA